MAFFRHRTTETAGPQARRSTDPQVCWAASLLSIALLLLCPQARPAEEAPLTEYEIKGANIWKFVSFSEWPAGSFARTNSPYVIGIVGRDPFGKDLDRVFEGKTVKGRSLVIRRTSDEQELRNCHLVFVSSSERRRSKELLEKLKAAAVLTVGESPDFLDQGGMINFLIKDGSVRFEINLEPVRIARLKLDVNLLRVAVSVRGKRE